MSQTRIARLERELSEARAQLEKLRIAMRLRENRESEQVRELEQAVQNLLHVIVPLTPNGHAPPFGEPFDGRSLWAGTLQYRDEP